MAKLSGYKVIATCSQSKEEIARATGADEVIVFAEKEGTRYSDYTSVDIVKAVDEITDGQGAKAVRSKCLKTCVGESQHDKRNACTGHRWCGLGHLGVIN